MFSYFQYKFGRQFRAYARDLQAIRTWWVNYFNAHIWGKWRQLGIIRRLILIWWGIVLVSFFGVWGQVNGLKAYYLTEGPASGGTYTEGVIGGVKNINPILPESSAASDASRLVFSGLTRFNQAGKLEGDLASGWNISADQKTYTFQLRRGVKWHDGVDFTAQDVVFTLIAIQNPDSRSPLAASWQGVRATAEDDHTVVFELPSPYAPFLYSTTVGILPKHLLGSIEPKSLRAAEFNQKPIGTGPFKISAFLPNEKEIQLLANSNYHHGRPRLDEFVLKLYSSSAELMDAYSKKQVTAIAPVSSGEYAQAERLDDIKLLDYDLPQQTNLFLKTTHPVLKERKIRQALLLATDREDLITKVLDGRGLAISLPLLPGQVGYQAKYRVADNNMDQARRLLAEAGWSGSPIRRKDGQDLKLRLVTRSSGVYPQLAEELRRRWREVGVDLEIVKVDVDELQQSHIRPRNYDILLYGVNLGPDPDVYSFWHSSQVNDPGLNLSQYSSTKADRSLESGRTVSDEQTRAVKYDGFLAAWAEDIPAIVLFRPFYVYGVNGKIIGPKGHTLAEPSDRFYGVEDWTVQTAVTPISRTK